MLIVALKILFLAIMYLIFYSQFVHPLQVHRIRGGALSRNLLSLGMLLLFGFYCWGLYYLIHDL